MPPAGSPTPAAAPAPQPVPAPTSSIATAGPAASGLAAPPLLAPAPLVANDTLSSATGASALAGAAAPAALSQAAVASTSAAVPAAPVSTAVPVSATGASSKAAAASNAEAAPTAAGPAPAAPADPQPASAAERGPAEPGSPPLTDGVPSGPAGPGMPAPARPDMLVRVQVPGQVPAAGPVGSLLRWVTGADAPGPGMADPSLQPSLSWAPIGQVALDRGAFDSALGLERASGAEGRSAQSRLEGSFRKVNDEVQAEAAQEQGVVASSVVVTTGLSVGYVLWLARGGALLASMASAIPMWASVDPLPVLSRQRARRDGDRDAEDSGHGAENEAMYRSGKDDVERMFGQARRGGALPAAPAQAGPAGAPSPTGRSPSAAEPAP